MRTDIQRRVVEDLLLNHMLLLVLTHLPLQEVERRVRLLHLHRTTLPLLLVEDRTEVPVLPIVLAPVHYQFEEYLFAVNK